MVNMLNGEIAGRQSATWNISLTWNWDVDMFSMNNYPFAGKKREIIDNWKVILDRMLSTKPSFTQITTADGRNPANQLRLVVFPIIYHQLVGSFYHYKVSAPSQVVQDFWSINSMTTYPSLCS